MKKIIPLLLTVVTLPLAGCFSADGAYTTTNRTPTLGQELMDLKKAEQAGAISPEQYEIKKSALLNK